MKLLKLNRLEDFVLFNFLAKHKQNAIEIMEAGEGYVVPGIVASDFAEIATGINKVKEIKEAAPIVSIGLGEGGNSENWHRALKIAADSNPGHLNQPFEMAGYSRGYLDALEISQMVNGLVAPSGRVGFVKLPTGMELTVEELVELAVYIGVESIKFMPLNGLEHLEELIYLCKVAARKGIKAVEPAGGISTDNIAEIVSSVQNCGIPLFMPHIFGSTIDKRTGETVPSKVAEIISLVRR
ncbi:imidazolonepropionase [Bacillus sp. V3-13]|uniref:KDGP aldolase n=1 Tax=Bacillus sp. V3-13 TaxID=2053728 RepID=UPI000C7885B4|nr:KDGP aldolase [Bacillus sp. V3-13]PLR75950.1 imidazolonepropionase [Bacillus sp. V3-13]